MTVVRAEPGRGRHLRRRPWVRLVRGFIVVAAVTGGAIAIVLWWEDRPLRSIEQALERRDFAVALELSEAYLKQDPGRSRAVEQKGRALVGLGRWTEAVRLFDRIGAESIAGQRAWSQTLLHAQRWTEALPLLTILSAASPQDADLLHELSACQARLGYFQESIQSAQRLAELPGNDRRGRLLLGVLHYKRGNNRLTIESWQPLLDNDPEAGDLQLTPAEFRMAAGRAFLDNGRPADARTQFERAYQLEPTADACNMLAETCETLGDPDRAARLWRQAVELEPAHRAAREALARNALENRSSGEAWRWLEPLLESPELHSSTAFLAQRAARLADKPEAAAKWEARAGELRKQESRLTAFEQLLRDSPQSFWATCVRAHRFASEGNGGQALLLAEGLSIQKPDEPFVRQLVDALRHQKPLPPLDLIPIEQH